MKYPIPKDAIERHLAILGKTGSGKSNTAKIIFEKLMSEGERVCVLDPTGTWWGVRLSKNGRKPSPYEPVIFGGNHADLPIAAEHGDTIAEAIGTSHTSAIIDTRSLTVGARTRFFTGFAEGLLRENRGALHLIIDEAHLFAPQGRVNNPQSGAMLHAANNLVSLGRGIGLRIILISQRPAKLHKDSLTQVETLVAMRLIAPQDRNAIKDWIGEWADPEKGKEIISSLPSLPTGDAWVWSPEIDMLERLQFPLADTFDSGRPRGEGDVKLGAINIEEMATRLESIKQEVVENDPKKLKARINELEKQLKQGSAISDEKLNEIEQNAFADGVKKGREKGLIAAVQAIQGLGDCNDAEPVPAMPRKPIANKEAREINLVKPRKKRGPKNIEGDPLLQAARAVWPVKLTWAALASTIGRKARGGHFNTAKKALIDGGFVREESGLVALIDPPTGSESAVPADLLEQNLPQPARRMFSCIRSHPGLSIDDLADKLELKPVGGHWNTGLSILRKNGLISENGGFSIAPGLE